VEVHDAILVGNLHVFCNQYPCIRFWGIVDAVSKHWDDYSQRKVLLHWLQIWSTKKVPCIIFVVWSFMLLVVNCKLREL
jgi:hypothetical protein